MNFISGLPRSGSTLLASLLLQNPNFHASISSPMGAIVNHILMAVNSDEINVLVSEAQRKLVIQAAFEAFYAEKLDKIIFDNNRGWCARMPLLLDLFPEAYVIACVRPLPQIVDSFERVFRTHPTVMSKLCSMDPNWTVFQRVNWLIQPNNVVGYAWDALREAYYGTCVDRLVLIEYDTLTSHPQATMDALHDRLRLKRFKYNPNKIEQIPGAAEFDKQLGAPALHKLEPKIRSTVWKPMLPQQLYPSLAQPFWYPEAVKESPTSSE